MHSDRIIEVEWAIGSDRRAKRIPSDIEISGFDRPGLLNEVMIVVTETKTNIAVSGKTDR